VLYWNKGAERLFGWSADEVMEGALAMCFFRRSAMWKTPSIQPEAGRMDGEMPKRHKDGRLLIVEAVRPCTDDEGNPLPFLPSTPTLQSGKRGQQNPSSRFP